MLTFVVNSMAHVFVASHDLTNKAPQIVIDSSGLVWLAQDLLDVFDVFTAKLEISKGA